MDAEHVVFAEHATLAGNRDLWLLRSLNVAEYWDATLNAPRLTGPGNVVLSNATLHIGNPANDFKGGVFVPRGVLNANVPAPNSTVLGAGNVALGQDDSPTPSPAILNFINTAGVPVLHSTPGALAANGVFNSGRVNIGGDIAARFGSLTQAVEGATLTLAGGGALLFDDPPEGVFPPWFVIPGGADGNFAIYKNGSVERADATDMAASGIASLSYDMQNPVVATSLYLDLHLTLHEHDLTLTGTNGATGILMRMDINEGRGGGVLDLRENDLYIYVEGTDRYLHPPIANAGGSLYKFGSHRLYLCNSGLPPRIIVQEGSLSLNNTSDDVYEGNVYAIAALLKGGPRSLTHRGLDGVLMNVQHLQVIDGRLALEDGEAIVRYSIEVFEHAQLDVTRATAHVQGAGMVAMVVRSGTSGVNVLEGGAMYFIDAVVLGDGNPGGKVRFTVANGGRFELNNRFDLRAPAGVSMAVTNNGAFKNSSYVRHEAGRGHAIVVHNASFQASDVQLGFNAECHDAFMDIQDGGRVLITGGGIVLGRVGENNRLRVGSGGSLELTGGNNTIIVGDNNPPVNNALILAGGDLTGHNLYVCDKGILAPEIQLDGLGETIFHGTVTLRDGAILRPSAVKGAPGGWYRVLTATVIDDQGLVFDSSAGGGRWDFDIDTSAVPHTLSVKLSKTGTMLMVR